jgi:hypothetical protein
MSSCKILCLHISNTIIENVNTHMTLEQVWSNPTNIGWTFGIAAGGDSGQLTRGNASSYLRIGTGTTATPL